VNATTTFPEAFLRLMRPEDRARLGKGGVTQSEAQHRFAQQAERRMHDEFARWLGLHRDELYWDHSRMDKATRNRKGHPDFVIQSAGCVLNIEFKAPGNTLSADQKEVHAWLRRVGSVPHVCFNVESAIALVRGLLQGLKAPATGRLSLRDTPGEQGRARGEVDSTRRCGAEADATGRCV
jgi:hypothetical protein